MIRALLSFYTRSIALRLTAAFVLFLMPVIYVGSNLVIKQNQEIAFSKQELLGTHFLRPSLQVHSAFVEAASQHAMWRSPSVKIDPLLANLVEEANEHGSVLDLHSDVKEVTLAAADLNAPGLKDAWEIKSHIRTARDLITQVAEKSNLILDPELSTYYLMEVAALRASPLIEQIAQYAITKEKQGHRAEYDYVELARQEGKLRSLQYDFHRSFEAAMKAGQGTKEAALLRRLNTDVELTIDRLIMTQIAHDAQMNSRAARQSILRTVLLSNDQLVALLDARIVKVQSQQQLVLFGGGILFLCSVVLALAALRGGIVMPLQELTEAMKKVASGAHNVEPPSRERRDEIGDMARALEVFRENAVARIQAEHAAAAKAEFLAVMSHEIRTPMNGVMGMTQALASTKLEAPQRKMLEVIQESGDTLLALLNDILDMSKIEAGKLELEEIAFAPERLLQSARDLFDERASQKGLQIVTKIDEGADVWRMGDPARLRQVVFNLVSNAIKFTQSGQVSLDLSRNEQGAMVVRVTDTGIGIPEQRLAQLFAKFTQADSSHTRVYGGTGLGLSIAKAIIEAMHGTIEVASEIGVGSVFTVTVPLETTQPRFGQEAAPIPPPPSPIYRELTDGDSDTNDTEAMEDPIRVLVAEDNATNRFVLQTLLDGIGIEPSFTENGQEALDAWQQAHYDVILMDMQMPIMDGLTAMAHIRRIESEKSLPRIPIVALTANAMGHQIAEQVNAGADAHCAKPIQLAVLIASIEDAIDRCDIINAGAMTPSSEHQLPNAAADNAA
jgi:signal transduction histidine kinase/DNA-binding NarL/FixJ family response regulator